MAYTTAPAPPPNPDVKKHGVSAYKRGRCRCAVCRAAWADYRRDKERVRQAARRLDANPALVERRRRAALEFIESQRS